MLFRKDMDPRCAYCQRGQQINEETERLKEEDFSL